MKLGVNVSNFPLSIGALGFHLGLGGIFGLYYVFWVQLDMFTTLKYLMGIGVVTFLCGNSVLAKVADDRKK
jgi:oligosaccharyltransferase complex subunit delta (ribophorin II)